MMNELFVFKLCKFYCISAQEALGFFHYFTRLAVQSVLCQQCMPEYYLLTLSSCISEESIVFL